MQNPGFPLPSATTIRRRLHNRVQEVEAAALHYAVPESKVAISLDCWSSSTRLSFMGVLVHYIDKEWNLHEELIGFENLKDVHSGVALAKVVNDILSKYNLIGRVISITTDNASNNNTMVVEMNEHLEDAFENNRFLDGQIQHIPCLSHIIQLGLKSLLGKIRLNPKNKTLQKDWEADQELDDLEKIKVSEQRGIPYVLAKVSIT